MSPPRLLGKQEENASLPKLPGTGRCWLSSDITACGDTAMPYCLHGLISLVFKILIKKKIIKNSFKTWKNIYLSGILEVGNSHKSTITCRRWILLRTMFLQLFCGSLCQHVPSFPGTQVMSGSSLFSQGFAKWRSRSFAPTCRKLTSAWRFDKREAKNGLFLQPR